VTHQSVAGALHGDVLAALAAPGGPESLTIEAAGIPFHVLAWGGADGRPLVIMHGVTSAANTWWRMGPALAAAGYRVLAPDLPGHGLTDCWRGHVAFRDNAADLVAFTRAAFPGREPSEVRVVGHSWGAMTAAAFPAAGYAPRCLVLIDPPAIPLETIRLMLEDPTERRFDDVDEAISAVGGAQPTWSYGDVVAKAESLTQFDERAVRAILTENGDFDGGLAELANPAATDVQIRLIRGDPSTGGLIPDAAVPAFVARLGEANVTTITGAPHSPHRTHPIETAAALLTALAD
jgi:pimeloyl-ACP methyl ester carboxylesterase